MARDFKKLEVWNLSYQLALDFYGIIKKFPDNEEDNIISQIKRAGTSIPLNIAEGCSRPSKNAFLQFMTYAYGSCRELEVLLMFSRDLDYISTDEYEKLNNKLDILSRKLFVFINNVKTSEFFSWFKD